MDGLKEYTFSLGKLWTNFNSLELLIRFYIAKKTQQSDLGLDGNLGEEIDKNPVTDYCSFRELTKKFNELSCQRLDFEPIAKLRDALAHGRVFTNDQSPLTVIKYSRPKENKVTVEYREVLNTEFTSKMNNLLKERVEAVKVQLENSGKRDGGNKK